MLICFPVSVLKGKSQYYPPSAPGLSEIFGMFHASTLQHSKDLGSLQDCHGTVSRGVARILLKGVLNLVSLTKPFLQLVGCIVLTSLATLSAFSLET